MKKARFNNTALEIDRANQGNGMSRRSPGYGQSFLQTSRAKPMQMAQEEDELQMKEDTTQQKESQRALQAPSGGGSKLPKDAQAGMEGAFGTDFSEVNIHQGEQAAQVGALAYTQGNNIHFAPGQYDPQSQRGQELLGHELTHVVQQRQGRVQPTTQAKGIPVNDDHSLEAEADAMGKQAAQSESDAAVQPSAYRSPALQLRSNLRTAQLSSKVIQRSVSTNFGEWSTDKYSSKQSKGRRIGVEIELRFKPNKKVDATLIGLVQTVKPYDKGAPDPIDKTAAGRMINKGSSKGTYVDRLTDQRNPVYGIKDAPATDTSLKDTTTNFGNMKHGFHYKDGAGKIQHQDAWLYDGPSRPNHKKNAGQIFETTALALDGTQTGTYYGSVQWGWTRNALGFFRRLPVSVVSKGGTSKAFKAAAKLWNASKTAKGEDTLDLP